VHVAAALGGAAEGTYEQRAEAAAVEEDEGMEREDGQGVAKRPNRNKLDPRCAGEWADLALDMEGTTSNCSASPSKDGDSEPQPEHID
jgi:hypothetical protein